MKTVTICAAISLLISIVFLYYLLLFIEERKEKELLINDILSQIELNNQALEASNVINEFSKDFKREVDLGTIGFANRLQWTDAIKTSANNLNIHDITFILKETTPLEDPDHPLYRDDVNINMIKMEIGLGTIHEGLVYDFFNILKRNARGTFSIEECSITRTLSVENINATSFQTNCMLQWFVIENPLSQSHSEELAGGNP